MMLKTLSIRRCESWENRKGYVGTLTTVSPAGEILVNLDDEACRQILVIAGKGIQAAAKATADFLCEESATLLIEGNENV